MGGPHRHLLSWLDQQMTSTGQTRLAGEIRNDLERILLPHNRTDIPSRGLESALHHNTDNKA